MSILLKQSYFSAFTRSKPMFRVLPYNKVMENRFGGGIGSPFGSHKTFLGNQHGMSYKPTKSDLDKGFGGKQRSSTAGGKCIFC